MGNNDGKEQKIYIPDEINGQYYLISGGYQGFAEISNVAAPSTISETVEFTDYFADNFN